SAFPQMGYEHGIIDTSQSSECEYRRTELSMQGNGIVEKQQLALYSPESRRQLGPFQKSKLSLEGGASILGCYLGYSPEDAQSHQSFREGEFTPTLRHYCNPQYTHQNTPDSAKKTGHANAKHKL
ncbi:hypothetical protein STEG23_020767, partial [Scotinomys teguina]